MDSSSFLPIDALETPHALMPNIRLEEKKNYNINYFRCKSSTSFKGSNPCINFGKCLPTNYVRQGSVQLLVEIYIHTHLDMCIDWMSFIGSPEAQN